MQSLSKTFSALSDPVRLSIVERLLSDGALSAGALGSVADISAPAMSRHLKVLREAGVIKREVAAQKRIYSVRSEAIRAIHDWTIDHEAFWAGSLERLAGALREGEPWET